MARMVRKQFYIDEAIERALAQRAETLGVQQAELVRTALRRYLNGGASDERRLTAWRHFKEFTKGRMARAEATSQPRTWTRDDAHGR